MILTIDIGNSNICFGVYEGKNALFTARAKTDPLRTETEYAVLLSQIFRLHQSDPAQLTGAAISSVVPALTAVFHDAVRILGNGHIPTIVVGPGVKTGLNIRIDEPASLGADLACTAVGAAEKYPLPAIIIDLGTATKITVVRGPQLYRRRYPPWRQDLAGGAFRVGLAAALHRSRYR